VTLKTALYLRTSTNEQHSENQLPALEAYAESRGWTIAATFYSFLSHSIPFGVNFYVLM